MESSGGSRPWAKEVPVLIFLPCWPFSLQSFLLFLPKIRGGGNPPRAPPLDPPLESSNWNVVQISFAYYHNRLEKTTLLILRNMLRQLHVYLLPRISIRTEWRYINTAWLPIQFQNGSPRRRFFREEFLQDSRHFKGWNLGEWKSWMFTCYRCWQKCKLVRGDLLYEVVMSKPFCARAHAREFRSARVLNTPREWQVKNRLGKL